MNKLSDKRLRHLQNLVVRDIPIGRDEIQELIDEITRLTGEMKQECNGCVHYLDTEDDFDYTCYECKRFHDDEFETQV